MGPLLRTGYGEDIHKLVAREGGELIVAGELVRKDMIALARTNGDVVFHAAIDALLGALARGDIGDWFSVHDDDYAGKPGDFLVEVLYREFRKEGVKFELVNIDTFIELEEPQLSGHRQAMRSNLAQAFGIDIGRVSVKSGSREGCDAVGQGQAIRASAIVLIELG